MDETVKKKRGFASWSPEKHREISILGGQMAHERGTAHEFTSEEARAAGRKGAAASTAAKKAKKLQG